MQTNCLRCGRTCQTGTPDPAARAIRHSATDGFCPDCMVTKFLLSIEGIAILINGDTHHAAKGPEILLGPEGQAARSCVASILTHTQMRESEVDWINVVGNWALPWPKGRGPKFDNF